MRGMAVEERRRGGRKRQKEEEWVIETKADEGSVECALSDKQEHGSSLQGHRGRSEARLPANTY